MENKNMVEKTAIIFIGIQASGKSTFYHERFEDYVHINLDTLHTRNREKLLLQECVESGRSFVVDNTNPTREDREKYEHRLGYVGQGKTYSSLRYSLSGFPQPSHTSPERYAYGYGKDG